MLRSFTTTTVFNGIDIEYDQTPDHGIPMDDNQSVYSKDCYILLVQDPPGSGNYVKKKWCWEDFNVKNHTTGDHTVTGDINTVNITYTGTLSGPTITTLQNNYTSLEALVSQNEADLAALGSGSISNVIVYEESTPAAYANSTWENLVFNTASAPDVSKITYAATVFTVVESAKYMLDIAITRGSSTSLFAVGVSLNGSDPNAGGIIYGLNMGSGSVAIETTVTLDLEAGDTFIVNVFASDAGQIPATSDFNFRNRIQMTQLGV